MSSEVKSWPNLVGQDGQEAAEAIKAETGINSESHFQLDILLF